ncbi:MAG: hypothetical protein V7K32_26035 [Nostoc sp.]|uniref:hypothetical protein n=1 Tax=Nostoc sp. TaxID=1180 RepID=UPI002FF68FA8
MVDSTFRPCFKCTGTIAKKGYNPVSTTMLPIQLDEITIFIPETIPESYSLLIRIKAGSGWLKVKSAFYNSVVEGNLVYVSYSTGRFSNRVYLLNVWNV